MSEASTSFDGEIIDNELLLFDRINVIRDTVKQYGEENFYLSFSGGKDSTVIHYLLDLALPDNKIPRVFINTGIEFNLISKFVTDMQKADDRFVIIAPSKPIKKTLEDDGYPFKSKIHSTKVGLWQRGYRTSPSVVRYINSSSSDYGCPKRLKYQFTDEFKLKVSERCCTRLKKEPAKHWSRKSGRTIAILGLRMEEGGMRSSRPECIVKKHGKVVKFSPLKKVKEDWIDWFVEKYNVKLCDLYYPPYNFDRTGCKGCPFNLHLQEELDTLEKLLPAEKKQCEYIWKPVYAEYRRIKYRLRDSVQIGLFDDEEGD